MMPFPPPEGFTVPGIEVDPNPPAEGGGFLGIPGAIRDFGENIGLTLYVIIGTAALAGLGSLMILAGTMALLGFKAGDVARLTPPGRAATLAEVAVKG